MSNLKDIRWQQRFENFEKAFQVLERTIKITTPSEAERGGLIQFFETTFELAWKTLKDYLQAQGFLVNSPRDTIKQAFQSGFIADGTAWMHMLEDRDLTTHTYDDAISRKIEKLIREKYFVLLQTLYMTLRVKV